MISVNRSASTRSTRRAVRLASLLIGASLACMLFASSALADFGVSFFDGTLTDPSGDPYTQAGGHPYEAQTTIDFNSHIDSKGQPVPDADVKDIHVDLPSGFIGNPTAAKRCTQAEYGYGGFDLDAPGCPAGSQVGVFNFFIAGNPPLNQTNPVYNMVPPPGVAAEFAFAAASTDARAVAEVGPGPDYKLSVHVDNISSAGGLLHSRLTFWGIPADPRHDALRSCPGQAVVGCSSSDTKRAFLTLPTSCLGPQTTTIHLDSWPDPGNFLDYNFVTHDNSGNPIGATGCNTLDFSPTVTVQPTSTDADSPTGLHVELGLPQDTLDDPSGLAEAHLKRAVVNLPEGMAVNPTAADGLAGCSPAEVDLSSTDPANCPDGSKIGHVMVTTPLLDHPLPGSVYLATQGTNPFNQLLALYIVIDDPATGVVAKLPGKVDPDPATGQLRATFDNNPQLPFSDLTVDFTGGSRASLVTPPTCGTYDTDAVLSPWSAADPDSPTQSEVRQSSSPITIDHGPNGSACAAGDPGQPGNPTDKNNLPFSPDFTAGTVLPQAGSYSPFVLKISKPDGTQELKQIKTTLPKGLTANLSGITKCSQADITPGIDGSTNCPAASQVGTVTVGAGAGSTPFYLTGQPVYLTEGYDGAPFGLAIDAHAKAGPFDLGHVVTRTKLNIDPATAQVSAESEELPNIIQGIPLHIRSVTLKMDRSNFIVNPSNCDQLTVSGNLTGGGADFASPADDKVANVSDRFQVGGCGGLGFSPKLTGAITNGNQGIHRSDHPNLAFHLAGTPGDANIAQASVTLPDSIQIDQNNIGNLCSEAELAATQCAGRSQIGSATATTPLLGTSLSGPVYAVSGSGGLPRLAVILNGEVHLLLRSDTSTYRSPKGGASLVNTFPIVPDAPVSSFDITIHGGADGYLVNNRDICGKTKVVKKKAKHGKKKRKIKKFVATSVSASAAFTAHDGDTLTESVPISASCPKAKKKKKGHKRKKGKKHGARSRR